MTPPPPFRDLSIRLPFCLLLAVTVMAGGCRRAEIQTYVAPKDKPPQSDAPDAPAEAGGETALPKLAWTLPAGWNDLGPDRMSVARFKTPDGATVMAMPAPREDEGNAAALVNLWRQGLQQPPLSDEDAAKALSEVDIAGGKGSLFEVAGTNSQGELKVATAFFSRGAKNWYFMIQGPPGAVEAQKPAFLEFLKSARFETAGAAPSIPAPVPAPAPVSPPPAPSPPSSEVPGKVPAEWTAQAPGAMQAAKFTVPGKDGTKAEVTVSIFASDTGGIAPNVARWRGQIGLPAADEAASKADVKPIPGAPEGAVMVNLENGAKALTGAIVPRAGQWYFYKLLGDTAAVTAAREAFITYSKAGS